MRPTQLVALTPQPSPSFNNSSANNHRPGSPSLSPEINMMLMSDRNGNKPIDMAKIDEIHRAVTLGNLRNVQQLIDRKRLAYCRDQMGATPLHKAVIYGQKEIIEYFLERFPATIHTRDNRPEWVEELGVIFLYGGHYTESKRGRTPLHYAAVLPESADLYRMLAEAGADEKALDMFGKKPEDYLNHQDGVSVVVLRESAIVTRPLGQRISRKSASRMIDPQSWSKIHSSRSLMHRSNIRELIKQGNISTLEEIVIQGYGDRLIGETSSAPLVNEFLKNVPPLIEQINEIHKAAQRGYLNDMRSLLDRKGIVFARDQIGCTPLHKAVLYGQQEVASFLSTEYPATLDARDHDGRTALHYAAGLDDDRVIYSMLVKNGASPSLPDYKGRAADYYLRFPDQINLQQLMKRSQRLNANYAINTANRIKSKSPCRRRGLSPEARKSDIHTSGYKSDTGFSDHETGDADGGSSNGSVSDASHTLLTKANLRSKPGSSLNFSSPSILKSHVQSRKIYVPGEIKLKRKRYFRKKDIPRIMVQRWSTIDDFTETQGCYQRGLKTAWPPDRDIQEHPPHRSSASSKVPNPRRCTKRKSSSPVRLKSVRRFRKRGEEITSANLRRWIQELDLSSLEGAILEGHGDRVKSKAEMYDKVQASPDIQNYIHETLPKVMNKIRKIHAAVSCGDLTGLQDHLDKNDYALAKDHLGMAPLHKAVILGHIDVVQFILDRFPETVNARDREGRTPLHYAAATTHKSGQKIYKMLLRSGADPRARDSAGKTADYYRVHLLPLPSELSRLAAHFKRKSGDGHQASSPLPKRRSILLPSIREKISNALHEGDAGTLLDLALEGYGDALLGRASWGEEARKFLKGLPHLLDSIKTLHASIVNGELANVQRILETDPNLIKAKDENGLMAIHLAVSRDQQKIIDYLLEKFPSCLHLKDQFGRTGLHIAAQNKQSEIYKKLIDAGGDPMLIDQRGRTADHYLKLLATGDAYLNKLLASNPGKDDPNQTSKKVNVDKPSNENEKNETAAVSETENNEQSQEPKIEIVEEQEENGDQNEKQEAEQGEPETNQNDVSQEKEALEPAAEDESTLDLTNDEPNDDDKDDLETKKDDVAPGEVDDEAISHKNVDLSSEKLGSANLVEENANKDNNVDSNEIASAIGESDKAVDAKEVSESEECTDAEDSPVSTANVLSVDQPASDDQPDDSPAVQENPETSGINESGNETDQPANNVDSSSEVVPEVADIDEEKLQNNRQDAKIDEKESIKSKKETKTKDADSKKSNQASKKKTISPPQANNGEKKMKGNRKSALPSVVSHRSSSKDRLDKKKSTNNRSASNIAAKGIAKVDPMILKEVDETKIDEAGEDDDKMTSAVEHEEQKEEQNDDTIQNNTNETAITSDENNQKDDLDEGSADKLEQGNAEVSLDKTEKVLSQAEEVSDQDSVDATSSNSSVQPSTDTNQAVKTPDADDAAQKSQVENQNQSAIESTKADVDTPADEAQLSQDENQHPSQNQTNIESVNEDVERQAKEIAQELVATSIQEAESKLTSGGDSNADQEMNDVDSSKSEETDSEVPDQAAINKGKDTSVQEAVQPDSKIKSNEHEDSASQQFNEADERKGNDDGNQDSKQLNNLNEPNDTSQDANVPNNPAIAIKNETESYEVNAEQLIDSTDETKPQTKKSLFDEVLNGELETSQANEASDLALSSIVESDKLEQDKTKNDAIIKDENSEQKTNADSNLETSAESDKAESNEIEKRNETNNNQTETLINGTSTGDENYETKEMSAESKNLEKAESEVTRPKSNESTASRLMSGTSVANDNNDGDMLNELIETWLKEGDLLRLEHVVIAGQGDRLIGKKSTKETVQEFLDLVPAYMAKIKNVHDTVVRGNFNEVRSILTRKRFALSRDHVGASPLHLAVLHGHMDVLVYIITQFPETLDGPDNEGRTPLHYAAVMASKDRQYYDILKKAGANSNLVDKLSHTADFYLENPDELTIGDLLSSYKHKTESATKRKDPESVDVWQRPPTADIESRLTPSPSDSQLEEDNGPTHHEIAADVHVDAKVNERPASVNNSITPEEDVKKEVETISVQFKETLKEEKNKLQESIRRIMGSVPSQPPESLSSGEESDEKKSEDAVSEYELCQVKDEHGRTVLHLVSSKPQKKAILYQMLASAEYLIPERDGKYRTIRDVAVDAGLKDNVQVIDNYILDAFVRRNVGFVQRLSHEGYDLTNVVDEEGHDVTSVLRKRKITSMINLLQDITYFQKSREELHTFIKNDYIQGVLGLIDSDSTLVTAKNKRGRTALHIAILFGNLDIISNLIDANPEAASVQDNLGRTPLHYAMATSKVEHIGKMLIKAGANRQIRDVKMRTPSYYFVYNDDIRAIRSEEKTLI